VVRVILASPVSAPKPANGQTAGLNRQTVLGGWLEK
jgi:hypothetical protein